MTAATSLAPLVLLAAALGWPPAAARAEAGRPLAVFPVELADTSGEAAKPGRAGQVAATTGELADLLEGSGRYREVDLSPLRDDLAAAGPLHRCGGCWIDMARRAGAEVAAVAVVHKVSTLVSSMYVWLVDVAARRVVRSGAVSLRGDTDEAWRRAAGYLARNVLLNESPDHPSLSSPFPGG
jgi:Protein of unknown function (DUF2380)